MATYKVQDPQGKIMTIEGPEGATDEQLLQVAAKEYYSKTPYTPDYTLGELTGRAFGRAKERFKSGLGDVLPAMAGSALGFDDYAKRQMEEAALSEEYIQRTMPPQYPSYKDVDGVADAGKFALETILEQSFNIPFIIGTGGVGGIGGRLAAKKAATEFTKKYTKDKAKKEISKKASERAALKITDDIEKAGRKGQMSGLFLGSYALNAPEVFQNIYEQTGSFDPGAAALAGVVNASLDSILPGSILNRLGNPGRATLITRALEKSGMKPSFARRATANVLGGVTTEGLTESAQEAVSIIAEKLSADLDVVFDSDEFDRMLESGIRGAVAGGGFNLASSGVEQLRQRALDKKEEAPADTEEKAAETTETPQTTPETPQTTTTAPLTTPADKKAEQAPDKVATEKELQAELDTLLDTQEGLTQVSEKELTKFFAGYNEQEQQIIKKDLKKLRSILTKDKAIMDAAETDARIEEQRKAIIEGTKDDTVTLTRKMFEDAGITEEYIISSLEGQGRSISQIAFMENDSRQMARETADLERKNELLKQAKSLGKLRQEIENGIVQRSGSPVGQPTGTSDAVPGASTTVAAKGTPGPDGDAVVGDTSVTGETEGRAGAEPAALDEKIYYRGTPQEYQDVGGTGDIIYFSPSQKEAETVGGKVVKPYKLKVKNTFDINNKQHVKKVLDLLGKDKGVFFKGQFYKNSERDIFKAATIPDSPFNNFAQYEIIEEFADAIATAGFDSFYVQELPGFATGARNIGVFDVNNIQEVKQRPKFSSPEVEAKVKDLRAKIPPARISEEQFVELAASFKSDIARENVESDVLPENPIDEVPPPSEPSKVTQYFDKIGKKLDKLPVADSAIGKSLISKFTSLPSWLANLYVGFLSIPNKIELFGDKVLGLRELEAFLEEKAFIIKQQRERISQVIEYVENIQKKYKQTPKGKATLTEWNKVLLELSRQNVDPTKILADPEGITKLKITDPKAVPFVERYDRLPKDLKEAAELIVADLKLRYDALRQVMMETYKDAAESIAEDFQTLEYYLPMVRKGDYWFSYKTKDGEEGKAAETSRFLREKRKEQLRREGATDFQDMDKAQVAMLQTKPPAELIQKILAKVKMANLDDKSKEALSKDIEEQYLTLFPEQSLRNQQQHRKGVPGYIEDVLFAYADTAPKVAASIANAKFNNKITNQANLIGALNFTNQPLLKAVVNDTIKSVPFYINPVADPYSSMAAYMSYVWFIGFNVSSGFVNLTQTPVVVQPFLAGEYGDAKATKALTNAYKLYFKGNGREHKRMVMGVDFADKTAGPYTLDLKTGKKTFTGPNAKLFEPPKKPEGKGGRYFKLFEEAEKSAALRRALSYEITELRKDLGEGLVTEKRFKAKTENVMNFLFQNSERLNRETTLIAAFDLAKDAGKSDEVAIQEAIELTHKAHSHALPEVGPRFFQTGWTKTMFIFKRFAQSQVYLASKLFFDVFDRKAKTPQELAAKRIAKKQLLRLYANSILAAGIQGAPFYGLVSVLVALLVDDDDDPITLDQWVNQTAGDVAYRGPLSYILGADVSQRIGFGDLIFRENAARLEKVGAFTYAVETMFGPAYSIGNRAVEGAGDVIDGNYLRGLEKMIPTALGNTLKTFRFATQGVRNRNGTPIVEDQSAYEAFMQIMGFTNIEISEAYARANALKRPERILTQRRAALLQKLYLADVLGDREGVKAIEQEIKEYNEKAPRSFKITNDTKRRSKRTKESRFKNSIDGVYVSKKYLKDLEDRYSLDED